MNPDSFWSKGTSETQKIDSEIDHSIATPQEVATHSRFLGVLLNVTPTFCRVNRVFQCVSFVWSNNLLMGHMHAAHTFSSKIRQERVFQEGVQRLENSKPKHLPLTLYLCRCLPWKRNVPRPKKGTAVLQTGATVKPASREKLGKTRYSFRVPSFLWKVTWMIPSTKASTSHTLVTCRSDMDTVFHLVMTEVLHFEGLRGMMILIDSWILVHHYLGFCCFHWR